MPAGVRNLLGSIGARKKLIHLQNIHSSINSNFDSQAQWIKTKSMRGKQFFNVFLN